MKKVTAYTLDGHKIRVSIPDEMWNETTAGHREIRPGVFRIAYKIGRKYMIVKNYSIWVNDRGERDGESYIAYRIGYEIVPEFHYADTSY